MRLNLASGVALLVTLLTTAGQLWLEYRRERAAIEARIKIR